MRSRSATLAAVIVVFAAFSLPVGPATAQTSVRLEREPTHANVELLEFRPIGPVVWIDSTSVALIDRDDQNVVVVNLASGVARTIGRRGQGPGELSNGLMMLARSDGGLLIGDMGLRRISEFDPSGSFVRSQPVPGLPLGLVGWSGDTAVAAWMQVGPAPRALLGELDLQTGDVEPWYSLFDVGLTAPKGGGPFSPPLISLAQRADGLILAGEGHEYLVLALDRAGTAQLRFGRPDLEPALPTEEQIAAARARAGRLNADLPPPPPELARRLEQSFTQPLPFFGPGSFTVDPDGRLWVITTGIQNDSSEVDVFSPEGRLVQTVRIRDSVQGLAFRGLRLAVLVARRAGAVEGYQGVDLYRLR